jgi:hypothetical protein
MERLGYKRYIVNGGDWGSIIAPELAAYEESLAHGGDIKLLGVHLNGAISLPPGGNGNALGILKLMASSLLPSFFYDDYDMHKIRYMKNIPTEMSYFLQQMTKPMTLGVALQNSPISLAAWLLEKFITWTDCGRKNSANGGALTRAESLDDKLNASLRTLSLSIPIDDMLTIISLYWFTNTITSSVMMYHNTINMDTAWKQLANLQVHTPVAIADFCVDIIWTPLLWAKCTYRNIIQYNRFMQGIYYLPCIRLIRTYYFYT